MDQLLAMRVFTRVVESGTFTKAADSLQMPKASVTKLVQQLEAHLRTTLLQRTTRRVTVTPDGAAYYERTLRLLSELDEIEAGMTNARTTPRGKLRVDMPVMIGRLLVIPNLPKFHEKYPEVQLELGVSDRPVDLVAENVDVVLRRGPITDESLVARRVLQTVSITVASPAYLEKYGMPRHPLDLENTHPIVPYFSALTGRKLFNFTFTRGNERVELENSHYLVSANESSAYVGLAMAGMGIIQVPAFMAFEQIRDGKLVRIFEDWQVDSGELFVVYPPNRHLSAKVRVFVDWVAELFATHECTRPRKPGEPSPCGLLEAHLKAQAANARMPEAQEIDAEVAP
jgi:LysR family transcriptional regulator for bpeEF and oprC